ncbi:MAG: tannase/feruloyl esterase family alpha/beta hydrolase [Deltaproteobacteria bacterium]|nr:tannase/feruloyl esterase family alpha/beta hydrolase [Deltaproteobacteria bacterium]
MFWTRASLLYLSFSVYALAIAACATTERGESVDEAAAMAEGPTCSLESLRAIPDVRLTSATAETEPALHCKVVGVIGTETHFELLLPNDWSGKFVMGGGGGFAGSVVNGAQDFWGALQMGYATVGTDTGHQAQSQDASWLTEDFYGQDISRSYFAGCSRGGGQALMEAQRYPEDFEGIVAAAPAYNWTRELGARWIRNAQRMYPDPTQIEEPVIGSEALKLISDAVMAQCDDLDGLSDGVLNDPRQCNFDVSSLACGDTTSNMCLSPEQVEVAEAIYGDFEIDGQVIPGTPVGAELSGWPVGWELWHTGGYVPGEEIDYHEGADSGEFSAPVAPNGAWAFATGIFRFFLYNDPDWTYADYDFADFSEKAARVASTLNADNPDLSAFRARGGKLIIDNGWMDGSMSAYGTIKYYESVLDFDPTAHEDVRLFVRPGVTHCAIGPGPDGTNYLAAIDAWVESGEAPEQLPALYRDFQGQPTGGGRILCSHPNIVTYDGSGDPRDPSSFSCQ